MRASAPLADLTEKKPADDFAGEPDLPTGEIGLPSQDEETT